MFLNRCNTSVTADVSAHACVTQTSSMHGDPRQRASDTLCFPFILQVSTSACLDFQVIFCKGKS